MKNTTRLTKQLTMLIDVWTELRPTKTFAGMTLEQFKAAVAPSLEARARLVAAHQQAQEAIIARDNADDQATVLVDRLVAAFVAEEEDGYNGVLYAKLGYVRKADRSSGLTRRAFAEATAPLALKAA